MTETQTPENPLNEKYYLNCLHSSPYQKLFFPPRVKPYFKQIQRHKLYKKSVRNQHTSHVSALIIMQVSWLAGTVANMTVFVFSEIAASLILSLTAIIGQTMREKSNYRKKNRNIRILSIPFQEMSPTYLN